jgi:hypothetical protein
MSLEGSNGIITIVLFFMAGVVAGNASAAVWMLREVKEQLRRIESILPDKGAKKEQQREAPLTSL